MAFCTECGFKLPDEAVFCPNCGATLTAPQKSEPIESNEIALEMTKTEEYSAPISENPQYATQPDSAAFQASGVYAAPAQTVASAPIQGTYTAPVQNTYVPPVQNTYVPPVQNTYVPPYQGGYTPQPQNQFNAPNNYGNVPYQGGGVGVNTMAPKKSGGAVAAIVISAVVVLLAVAALLIFKPFGNRYVGYWESVAVDVGDGVKSSFYYDEPIIGALSFQINSDGSAYLATSSDTEIISATWEKSDDGIVITTEDDSHSFVYADKQLVLEEEGEFFFFDKVDGDINHPSVTPSISDSDTTTADNLAGSGYVGDGSYYITITGAEDFTDIDGDPAIRIYYDFTNNYDGDYSSSAWDVLSYYATQDGMDLTETYSVDEYPIASNASYNIRPGVMMQCCAEFKYDPYGGSVDFNVYGYYEGESGGAVFASYVPGEMPGAPDPYVIVPVLDPQWTKNVPGDGALDSFYVSVLDAELITDADGNSAIRIYYEFTNNGSYATSLGNELYVFTYQDGISLDTTYTFEDFETDMDYYTEVAPGTTITVSCVYRLRNLTSPVEAEVEAYSDYAAVGQTYDIA